MNRFTACRLPRLLASVISITGVCRAYAQPVVIDLGLLPTASSSATMRAVGISRDGAVVGGWGHGASEIHAFRYENGQLLDLGKVPTFTGLGHALTRGISGDGSTIVGETAELREPFRWTSATGLENMNPGGGALGGFLGCNFDGTVIVGDSRISPELFFSATVWRNGVRESLGWIGAQNGVFASYATGVSDDGLMIVGASSTPAVNGGMAFLHRNGVMTPLATPSGRWSEACALNGDGTIIVGQVQTVNVTDGDAAIWAQGELRLIGKLVGGQTICKSVSGDGLVVGGIGLNASHTGAVAFLWTETLGLFQLLHYLAYVGADAGGWAFESVTGIDAHGTTICGYGYHNGLPRAFVITGLDLSRCRADFDASGFVDTDDFSAFVTAFEAGSIRADVNLSGFVDTDDFDAYVEAFIHGC